MSWRFFIGAGVLAGYAMLAAGAPPIAVSAGIALAAGWNWTKRRKESLT